VAVLGFAVWGPVEWPYFQLGVTVTELAVTDPGFGERGFDRESGGLRPQKLERFH